jgi:hypothetical protein
MVTNLTFLEYYAVCAFLSQFVVIYWFRRFVPNHQIAQEDKGPLACVMLVAIAMSPVLVPVSVLIFVLEKFLQLSIFLIRYKR